MPTSEVTVLGLMRENAALCNLEAEVIIALKAFQVQDQQTVYNQLNQIVICLKRIDEVRRRNDEATQQESPRED
jgi:hypothetical protein